MQIVGQKSNLDLINSWVDIPNFIIIQGDKNTGKTTLALAICEKFNMHYVKMKNGVNDVRELIQLMTPNSNTVYHFKDFDKASIQAKNALLKITEETPAGNTIIITGSTQIRTLESRARKLVMSAYTLDEVRQCMQKYIQAFDIQQRMYVAGINTPSKVEKYCKYEQLEQLLGFAFQTYNKITMLEDEDVILIMNTFQPKKDDEIDKVILFLSMLIHIMESTIINKMQYDYYKILNVLIPIKESLEKDYTLNRKLALFRAFYTLRKLRGSL